MISAALIVAMALTGAGFAEPYTDSPFDAVREVGGYRLALTGADYRLVWGDPVYAIAHYVEEDRLAGRSMNLEQAIALDAAKAIQLYGTYDSVPARGIRWSWKRSLKKAGYRGDNLKPFVKSFDEKFRRGTVLTLFATPEGTLIAEQDGEKMGEWADEALVEAVWRVCLGKHTEVKNPANLLATDHLTPLAR